MSRLKVAVGGQGERPGFAGDSTAGDDDLIQLERDSFARRSAAAELNSERAAVAQILPFDGFAVRRIGTSQVIDQALGLAGG